VLWQGGYPRIHDRDLPAAQWLADYTATYLERDVRSLLGVEEPGQLATHPLRGALFEGWVASEIVKWHRHRGLRPAISFYRERDRHEIDFVLERGVDLTLVEAKAGRTPTGSHFAAFPTLADRIAARGDDRWRVGSRLVVYIGWQRSRMKR
jgi:predicted AAA+ superfamily ATPase